MKKFKLYGYIGANRILITNSENLSSAATFEENMSLQEHMKSSLSFRISDTLDTGESNPYFGLVYVGAKIRIELEDNTEWKTYDFIVNSIGTEFYKNIIVYHASCEDYASVIYSKEGQGLSMEFTGTLKECAREVLLRSRKNLGYRGLNQNFLNFSSHLNLANGTVKNLGVTFAAASTGSITFPRVKDQLSTTYLLTLNLLSVPSTNCSITISQLDYNFNVINTTSATVRTTIGIIPAIEFTVVAGMAYYKVQFVNTGTGTTTAVDFKLLLKETAAILSLIDQSLKLSDSFNQADFKGDLGDISYYKKVTLVLSGSNLYNGLIELAKLFDAELVFDYINNAVNFLNRSIAFGFKGYRLSPTFNLLSLSRDELFDQFNTALTISGNSSVYSIFPTMPSEFKQYLQTCVDNGFIGAANFETYNAYGYETLANTYIIPTMTDPDRIKLVLDFAKAADKVPNLENVMYGLEYYNITGKITGSQYTTFNNIIKNDLRKTNIKLRLYGDRYQTAHSLLSSLHSQIDDYTLSLVVENRLLKEIEAEIAVIVADPLRGLNSEDWITQENARQNKVDLIYDITQSLMLLYNLTYDIDLNPTGLEIEMSTKPGFEHWRLVPNSYTSLMLNVYGYYNIAKNGIQQKIDEVKDKIQDLANTKSEQQARIILLQTLIDSINNEEDPRSIEASVERDGLIAQVDASVYTIGEYTDIWNPTLKGKYHYQLLYLNHIMTFLGSYAYKETLVDYSQWIVGSPKIPSAATDDNALWNYTGTVNTVNSNNKNLVSDTMMQITTSGTAKAQHISLKPGDLPQVKGLFKVPASSTGTITVSLIRYPSTTVSSMSFNIGSAGTERWVGFKFNTSSTGSAAYLFPAESTITLATSTNAAIPANEDTYRVHFTWSGTGGVFLYRPRVELIIPTIPTLSDMYYLYDNPIMNGFTETIRLPFNLIEGLYDLLYNENYYKNVTVEKQVILNGLYKNYEQYLIEGRYDNNDEIDAEGLMEQALITFEQTKYPKINYGVSVIDLSAVEDYKFLNLNVWDKIKIAEDSDRLYKSYQSAVDKYLQISAISYDLRHPESTTLTVAQIKESSRILQYILKATL